MYISKIQLHNWRNFKSIDISLKERNFIIGANATGKSNLLDAIRFLRDVVRSGGGLQAAIQQRKGISRIRHLNARQNTNVCISIEVSEFEKEQYTWKYTLEFNAEKRGKGDCYIVKEELFHQNELVFSRPNDKDKADKKLLSQTHLEQITQNGQFRSFVEMLESINYFHLVPQLLRHPEAFSGPDLPNDPFGKGFLAKIARTSEGKRKKTLDKIGKLLSRAVPQLKELAFERDEIGQPHLKAIYDHWRPNAGQQSEVEFSDGTLRLIALLWTLYENQGVILLEEPELSLHKAVVAKLPELFYLIQKNFKKKRQYIVTTHSEDLLSDKAIGLDEIQILIPDKEGTKCISATDVENWREMLAAGLTPAEIALPQTKPENLDQLTMNFGE
ncbi:MAG: AAA family ATPase [Planctomycetia bacterium]|nr:AAA family ATPase [Planctomycetia bacterium]